jgi:hypothetical protein
MEILSQRQARRLALARAGLLKTEWTGLPSTASGRGKRAREAAHRVIRSFGYLQVDSISVAGARTHGIVLGSRLAGFDPSLAEELLAPGEPLFEYWGHEASWLPIELYPAFEFRRREFQVHPWWGDLLGQHPEVAERLLERLRDEGPLRSVDFEADEGRKKSVSARMVWVEKLSKKVALALWSAGEIAVRERRNFQRIYDLTERVIPTRFRDLPLSREDSLKVLLEKALEGHGWATTGTLSATWRLANRREEIGRTLEELEEEGRIVACAVHDGERKPRRGWIRTEDLELAARLDRARPRRDRGVLLSPFDPLLWDRARVRQLFGFDQVLEIFKPPAQRVYGYYCLPVLAGEELVGRVDLKADRKAETLAVLSRWYKDGGGRASRSARIREAVETAVASYSGALGLELVR